MNKTSKAPLISCIKTLLSDGNYSFPQNFQIAQKLYAHPVALMKVPDRQPNNYIYISTTIDMIGAHI